MGFTHLSIVALTCFVLAEGQYGPLKGSSTRRTTTPFPPGFQSDNQLYNSDTNSVSPDSNQISHGFNNQNNVGAHTGSYSGSFSGCGGTGCGAPTSGHGVLAGSNQKTPAGAVSYSDNPWLSGIVAQNSGPAPSYQQTNPSVPCNAPGHVCVSRHQCQGGQTSSPGSGNRQCDINTEVCCQYGSQQPGNQGPTHQVSQGGRPGYGPTQAPHQQPAPSFPVGQSFQGQSHQSAYPSGQASHGLAPQPNQPVHGQIPHSGQPTHGQAPQPQFPSQAPYPQPGQTYQPSSSSNQLGQRPHPGPQQVPHQQSGSRPAPQGPNYYPGSQASQSQPAYQSNYNPGNNGIPIGGSIYDSGASRPVTPAYGPYTGPLNTTPHPGCPAALKCVEEIYCDVMGVMRDAPVQLTREEYENRVPLSECQNIETGIIGKCCRDPNYKDPWPDMNNGGFDDGHFHGDHGGHHPGQQHHPSPQGQFHQQGTTPDSCGPSATCTPQSQCSGGRQTQPGKHCQVPQDGSTGVCCSKPPFPSFSNNQQINPSTPSYPATQSNRPGHQYYTPKPSYSNNPFLSGNVALPSPQTPSNQGPIHPAGISPINNYTPSQPNALPGQQKDYNYGKQSTPKPIRPATTPQTPGVSATFQRPGHSQSPVANPQPQIPSSQYPQPPATPNHQLSSIPNQNQSPSLNYPQAPYDVSSTPVSHPRPTERLPTNTNQPAPSVNNQPVFPQIATANSVYTPRPGQLSPSSTHATTPTYQSSTAQQGHPNVPNVAHQRPLPVSNVHSPTSFTTVSSTLSPPVESNEITPAAGQPSIAPEKGRGPPAGYPFLQPTTESSKRRPGDTVSSSDCGVRRDSPRPNGPNGLETGFGEFPWQVQVLATASQTPICSGAILSAKVIVTAAHCVDDFSSPEVSVKAGDWKLAEDRPDELKPTQIRQVAAISRHPKYDPVSRFYDMAVLILSQPLQIDEHVDVLCLGDNTPLGQKPAGSNCVITGWGKASLQSNTPGSTLHSIPVSFIESTQCENTFRQTNLGKYFQLNKSFVCAVPNSPKDDLCQVDVGSPIACQKSNGRYELSGIYSWDVGCHQPVAASNVDKPWVQSVMRKPVEQVQQEERAEMEKKGNLGFNPENSDLNKPGFSQGYGKK